MKVPHKKEYPPLLPAGFHALTLSELRKMCVDAFPASATRADIMKQLEQIVTRLRASNIEAEVWIDGSFLTEKIDPDDSDIVLKVENTFLHTANPEQKDLIRWIASNLKGTHKCHSFFFQTYPKGHRLHPVGESYFATWARDFGFSYGKPKVPKGIGVLALT